MNPFIVETGTIVPLDRSNVDTDAMLPKQFLKSIKRTGFGVNLFEEWRYLDEWHPDIDYSKRPLNYDFVLNFPIYEGATLMIARDNFACGSSREHAVWALDGYGIRSVIAPSFGDIFFNNCFKNGILPVQLTEEEVDIIFKTIEKANQNVKTVAEAIKVTVNLAEQTVTIADLKFTFDIDLFRKDCLLKGLDEIGVTLENVDAIKEFEKNHQRNCPWVFAEHGA